MSFCRSLGIVTGAAVLCCGFQLSCPAAEWKLNTVLPADILQGWGAAEVNRSVAGNQLRVGGTAFAEGIGTHANGEIRLLLDGTAKRIIGAVGVDDGCGGGGSVRFLLLGVTLTDSDMESALDTYSRLMRVQARLALKRCGIPVYGVSATRPGGSRFGSMVCGSCCSSATTAGTASTSTMPTGLM